MPASRYGNPGIAVLLSARTAVASGAVGVPPSIPDPCLMAESGNSVSKIETSPGPAVTFGEVRPGLPA